MLGQDVAKLLECSKTILNEAAVILAKLQQTEKELMTMVTSCDNTMSDIGRMGP